MPQDMPRLSKKSEPRIAFYGPMCSGKTFLANYLVYTYGYTKVGFANKLKALAYELFDVSGKDGQDRIILQQLGVKMREIDSLVWIKHTLRNIKYLEDNNKHTRIVVDDLRFKNEEHWLRKNGFILIRVESDENTRVARIATLYPNAAPEASGHASEQEWRGIKPDYIIKSNDVTALVDLETLYTEILLNANQNSTYRAKVG